MNQTMQAARIYGPSDIRIVGIPVPEVGPGDVLCRVVTTGICGTDYAIYTGEISFAKDGSIKFPMTPGHEWSGIVERVGADVKDFKAGDRVVGDTAVSCGVCYNCLIGKYLQCEHIRAVGTIFTWEGSYAKYIMMPARHTFHLPDSVSFDNGAMVEPAATALYSVLRADVAIGDSVLVNGTGPIGIMAAKLALVHGASRVIITGRKDFKLQKARDLGIDVAVNVTKESLADAVGPKGVDKVIEASGSVDLLRESLKLIRPGGTISLVAFYERLMDGFDLDRVVIGDISIRGVSGSLGAYMPVLRLMESGTIDFSSLVTGRYTFDQIPEAMEDMKSKNDTRIKMMVDMENQ